MQENTAFDINELAGMTPDEIRAAAAARGITLSKTQTNALAAAQKALREQYAEQMEYDRQRAYAALAMETEMAESLAQLPSSKMERAVAALTTNLPRVLGAIQGVGKVIITVLFTLIVEFGLLLILPLLLFVEITRVAHGVALFETDHALTVLAAAVLVGANFVLEAVIHHRETTENYHSPRATDFSLRKWANDLVYVFGLSRDWKPRLKSPAHRERGVLRVVTFAIIMLALAGSMQSKLAEQGTTEWHKAFVQILTDSDSLNFTTWLTGLIFTLCAVLLAQILTRYVAARAAETYAALAMTSVPDRADATRAMIAEREQQINEQLAAALERLEVEHVVAAVAAGATKKRPSTSNMKPDFLSVPLGMNGHN